MATQRIKFTEGSIDKLPFSKSGTNRYADQRKGVFPNLYLDVGTKTKTWRLVKFAHGKTKSKTLGKWPAMNLHSAAQAADTMSERVADATHALPAPVVTQAKEISLRQAFLRHTTERVDPRTKEKTANTVYDYLSTLQNHAGKDGEWLDVPIDQITRAMINADVRQGSLRNAVLYSVGANAAHGARRTNEDKRQAVSRLLNDPEWAQWSDREIARQCRVGNKFVGDVRKAICVPNTDNIFQPLEDKPKRKVTRNGTTYTQNTANIGSAKPGYVRNETGGYTKEGFEPPDPQMTYTDTSTGEVLHHPWSKEKQESRREISGVTLDLLDNLKWITALTKEQVGDKVLPRYREEVDGLLWRAAAHLRNLVDERNQPHDTQEESIKHSN